MVVLLRLVMFFFLAAAVITAGQWWRTISSVCCLFFSVIGFEAKGVEVSYVLYFLFLFDFRVGTFEWRENLLSQTVSKFNCSYKTRIVILSRVTLRCSQFENRFSPHVATNTDLSVNVKISPIF